MAYQMLGSLSEADDVVEERWLRLSPLTQIASIICVGWLTTVVALATRKQQAPTLDLDWVALRKTRQDTESAIGSTLIARLGPKRFGYLVRIHFDIMEAVRLLVRMSNSIFTSSFTFTVPPAMAMGVIPNSCCLRVALPR